jgi:hypothetical protein
LGSTQEAGGEALQLLITPCSLPDDHSPVGAAVAAQDLHVTDHRGGDPRPGHRRGDRPGIHPCRSYGYSHDSW